MSKIQFSKALLVQESVLIWIITISYIILAFVAILTGYAGSLPWLSVIPGLAWGAYAVSQACYYNKSKAENTEKGVVYETTLIATAAQAEREASNNFEMPENPPAADPFGPM